MEPEWKGQEKAVFKEWFYFCWGAGELYHLINRALMCRPSEMKGLEIAFLS